MEELCLEVGFESRKWVGVVYTEGRLFQAWGAAQEKGRSLLREQEIFGWYWCQRSTESHRQEHEGKKEKEEQDHGWPWESEQEVFFVEYGNAVAANDEMGEVAREVNYFRMYIWLSVVLFFVLRTQHINLVGDYAWTILSVIFSIAVAAYIQRDLSSRPGFLRF